jgi:hypothetical protein
LYDNKTTTVTTDNFEAERQKAVSEIHSRIAEGCRTRTDFTIGPISIRWAGLLAYVETADVPAVELKEYDADDDGKFMSKLEDRIMEVAYTHKNATKPPRKARKQ